MKLFQVDAFAEQLFTGNPAAVVPLNEWISDAQLQNVAMENNLAETAFFVPRGTGFEIRWFTPVKEVDLCGHATLASAHVLFQHLGYQGEMISFHSRYSGPLNVYRQGDLLVLDFPSDVFAPVQITPGMVASFNLAPVEVYQGKTNLMFVYESEQQVVSLLPNLPEVSKLPMGGVIVTAPGSIVDFVSRYFAPKFGIDEDPVTGSAHTTLIPFWSKRLGRPDLAAMQLSKRRGLLACKDLGERVLISGKAKTYLIGDIFV